MPVKQHSSVNLYATGSQHALYSLPGDLLLRLEKSKGVVTDLWRAGVQFNSLAKRYVSGAFVPAGTYVWVSSSLDLTKSPSVADIAIVENPTEGNKPAGIFVAIAVIITAVQALSPDNEWTEFKPKSMVPLDPWSPWYLPPTASKAPEGSVRWDAVQATRDRPACVRQDPRSFWLSTPPHLVHVAKGLLKGMSLDVVGFQGARYIHDNYAFDSNEWIDGLRNFPSQSFTSFLEEVNVMRASSNRNPLSMDFLSNMMEKHSTPPVELLIGHLYGMSFRDVSVITSNSELTAVIDCEVKPLSKIPGRMEKELQMWEAYCKTLEKDP